jgi:hypothetical protein
MTKKATQADWDRVKKPFRDGFEEKLPELLEKAEEVLWEEFEKESLPELLEKAEEQLRGEFEGHSLPILVEKAEEQLRENFENELQERLDDAVA